MQLKGFCRKAKQCLLLDFNLLGSDWPLLLWYVNLNILIELNGCVVNILALIQYYHKTISVHEAFWHLQVNALFLYISTICKFYFSWNSSLLLWYTLNMSSTSQYQTAKDHFFVISWGIPFAEAKQKRLKPYSIALSKNKWVRD